jgi:hypothetical protein
MEILGVQISNLPKPIESQIYYPTETKQKQMYLSKIEGQLERLGRPLMADQRAYSKVEVKNMKFSEVDQILNTVPARITSQCANAPGRPLVERINSSQDLTVTQAPLTESKCINTTMKERRKSIQSSLGNAIAKLSGSKPASPVTSNPDIEKPVSSPTGIRKSKKVKGSEDNLAVEGGDEIVKSPSKTGIFSRLSFMMSANSTTNPAPGPMVEVKKDGSERTSVTGQKRASFHGQKLPSTSPLSGQPASVPGDVMVSAVQNVSQRLNNQAAEGLNIGDDKQREIINIVKIGSPAMASQRAEKSKSYISAIKDMV